MKNRNQAAEEFRAAHDHHETVKAKRARFLESYEHQRALVRDLEQKAADAAKAKDAALLEYSLQSLGKEAWQARQGEHAAAQAELADGIELLKAMEANQAKIDREEDEAKTAYKKAREDYFVGVAGDIEAALQRDSKLRTSLAELFACYALAADGSGTPRWDMVLDGAFPFLNDAEYEAAIGRVSEKHLVPLGLADPTRKAS